MLPLDDWPTLEMIYTLTHLNSNTVDALRNYISHPDPGFAVLVAGPWGVGKTHLIKAFAETFEGKETPLMVSLFGVTSADDIDSAIFVASLPKIDNQYIKAAGRLAKTALKIMPEQFASLDAKDFLKLKLPRVLIFDDLERTKLTPQEILGAINGYVEQERKHVILLANEEKLFDADTSGEKEKVIGQTLTVVADIEAALGPMLEKLGENASGFLTTHRAVVIDVFHTADYGNLRSLAQVLWDFGRLYDALTPALREKTEGVVGLLKVFVALGLEVKKGVLGRKELEMRGMVYLSATFPPTGKKKKQLRRNLKRLDKAIKKYGGIAIKDENDENPFPTEIATSIIIDGSYNVSELNRILSQTGPFIDKETEQEWQTVWWALHREPQDVEAAFKSMKTKIEGFAYTDPGIILHVFLTRLKTVEMGLEEQDEKQIEKSFCDYVDQIAQDGTFPMGDGLPDGYGYDENAYLGLGYPRENDPRMELFKRMFAYMRSAQDTLFQASFASQCEALLGLMVKDSSEAAALLAESKHASNPYFRQPILAKMDAARFVETLCGLPSEDQAVIYRSLENRFDTHWPTLEPERKWLERAIEALQAEANKSTGVARWQLQSRINIFLRPHLVKHAEEGQA